MKDSKHVILSHPSARLTICFNLVLQRPRWYTRSIQGDLQELESSSKPGNPVSFSVLEPCLYSDTHRDTVPYPVLCDRCRFVRMNMPKTINNCHLVHHANSLQLAGHYLPLLQVSGDLKSLSYLLDLEEAKIVTGVERDISKHCTSKT
jgi:hypothetical protein